MFFQALIGISVVALTQEVIAHNIHRQDHQLFHKRAHVTDVAIVTDCTTTTAHGETTSPEVQFFRGTPHSGSPPVPAAQSHTVTQESFTKRVSSISSIRVAGGLSAATTTAFPTATASSASARRGLAYNDEDLLPGFLGSGSKVTWKYNWDQIGSRSDGLEFVPMLWGTESNLTDYWTLNADAAIAAGSTCLLSFNEPDNWGQANLSVAAAVAGHIKYMNPYASKARISTPAITNSVLDGEGISWLTEFISECQGNCAIDFAAIHWYSPVDAQGFLQHLLDVYTATNMSVWITEFAPSGTDDEIESFLETVMFEMDFNATFSFVERYSYYMVAPGSLISSGTALSEYGSTFAFY